MSDFEDSDTGNEVWDTLLLDPRFYDDDEAFDVDEETDEDIPFSTPFARSLPRDLIKMERLRSCRADHGVPEEQLSKWAVPDWDAIAKRAGLDADEKVILTAKLVGCTRERLLDDAKDDKERKRFGAAWRRFNRKWPAVVAVIQTGSCVK